MTKHKLNDRLTNENKELSYRITKLEETNKQITDKIEKNYKINSIDEVCTVYNFRTA